MTNFRNRQRVEAQKLGKWLSNVAKEDVAKIKRAFPKVIVGLPKAIGQRSAENLYDLGLVGLYLGEKENE